MPAISSMMKRLGFVRLRDYGLVLTPEGRILSIRPAVLDDGLGGRIVGWKDDDLAAMELDRWTELGRAMAQKPAALPAVANAVAVRPIAPLARTTPPLPPISAPTPQKPLAVAPEPIVEEDDWEWTIAIARARAAAEESEMAAASAQRPSGRRRADTVPPPTGRTKQPTPARPLPAAAMAMARSAAETAAKAAKVAEDPIKRDSWESTQPLSEFDVSDHTSPTHQVLVSRSAVPTVAAKPIAKIPPPLGIPTPPHPLPTVKPVTPPRTYARGISPVTVIPIPRMPRVEASNIAPVVRRTGPSPIVSPVVPIPPALPRRLAKGTGPVLPPIASAKRPIVGDETTPNLNVGDKTLPSMILPRGA